MAARSDQLQFRTFPPSWTAWTPPTCRRRIYGTTAAQANPGDKTLSGGYAWSICPTFAGCLDTSQDQNLVSAADFHHDARNGVLPAFSVVTPGGPDFTDSCHNSFSMTACDNWIGSLVQSVQDGPDWSSTAIFITFDDFGGFYDQVPPPATLNANGQQAGPGHPSSSSAPMPGRATPTPKRPHSPGSSPTPRTLSAWPPSAPTTPRPTTSATRSTTPRHR